MTRRTRETPVPPAGEAAGAAKPDFETAMRRLETIVQELESAQVPLERAMQLFEEGLQLGKSCRAQLDAAAARIDTLLEKADGGAEPIPFEPAP